jgi:transposase-like protein
MSVPTKEIRKRSKLTPAQWAQIVTLWELGKVTMSDLARTYHVSEEAIRQGLKKRGTRRGSRAHEIAEATIDASRSQAKKEQEAIREMKERYLGYTNIISKLAMREIADAVKGSVSLATKKEAMITLQKASAVVSRMRDENFHIYGLYDQPDQADELPDIGIGEYTAEELAAIQGQTDPLEGLELGENVNLDDINLPFGDEEEEDEEEPA